MPTVQLSAAQVADLVARGLIPEQAKGRKKKKAGKQFVEPSVEWSDDGKLTFVIPLATASEVNGREWRTRSNRTKLARDMVSRAFGKELRRLVPYAEAFHSGKVLRLTFTRLGGYKLDTMANLGSSLKSVEDAVAMVLGASDGAANWKAKAEQSPGGLIGVKIELEVSP